MRTEFIAVLDASHRVVVFANELRLVRVKVDAVHNTEEGKLSYSKHTEPRDDARPDLLAEATSIRNALCPRRPCHIEHRPSLCKLERCSRVAQVVQVDVLHALTGARGRGSRSATSVRSALVARHNAQTGMLKATHAVPAAHKKEVGVGRVERER